MARGRFIALEGIDGSGTSSQRSALAQRLEQRGHRVLQTCEPSTRSIGALTRARLATAAEPLDRRALALLFAADRLDHIAGEIEPALAEGQVVITDRYLMSSWAYQSLDCSADWVEAINRYAPWPDLTFLIDVPADVAGRRVAQRKGTEEIFETAPLQRRLEAAYRHHAARPELADVHVLDGTASMAAVTDALLQRCIAAGL